MARDPLQTVLLLRQRAVDEARLNLAKAVAAEATAEAACRAAEQDIETEGRLASDLGGGDDLVEAYAAWLPAARNRARLAAEELDRLGLEVNCRRAEFAASRTALEVIETLLKQKRDALAEEQSRKLQREVDEAAGRRSLTVP